MQPRFSRRNPSYVPVTPDPLDLTRVSSETLADYARRADAFWAGTRDHDVRENIAALLRKAGYKLSYATPVDLFPHTFHVEVVSVYDRRGARRSSR